MDFKCFQCKHEFADIKSIFSHMKIVHSLKTGSAQLICVVNNNCTKSYQSFDSLRVHIKECVKTRFQKSGSINDHDVSGVSKAIVNEYCSPADMVHSENQDLRSNWCSVEFIPPVTSLDKEPQQRIETKAQPGIPMEYEHLEQFFSTFSDRICELNLIERDVNTIHSLCISLARNLNKLNERLIIDPNGFTATEALKSSTDYVCSKLSQSNTSFKRQKRNQLDEFYVEPKLKAIGTRFECKKLNTMQPALPILLQCSFPYISLIETLKCAFKNQHFLETYLKYNEIGNGHICKENAYTDFCCGSVFKKSHLFKEFPKSIQIQIFIDDFEPCNPLGAKATIHKLCGVYMAIRNMPYNSKLNSIYLIALCNSDDLKTKSTDFNDIWRLIVDEIKVLETDGINVGNNFNLKGTLIEIIADNLGANGSLGFVESFNATNFCRICEMPKRLCQTASEEDSSALRSIESYQNHLKTIDDSTKVDVAKTTGIKRDCDLNKLKYFHIMENFTVDVMHDIAEGVIPITLHHLFQYCIQKKICTEENLVRKIQYFDYGVLNRKNVPSMIQLNKHNLNQSAAQSMCLFQNIPFILREYMHELKSVWLCIESLLKIVQTINTTTVFEHDLGALRENICVYLKEFKIHFSSTLTPKQHFLTHYPTIIRCMGSVKVMSTIRFEAKHQIFKNFSRKNKNFQNLPKTLALKHQKAIAQTMRSFGAVKIQAGKRRPISDKEILKQLSKNEIFDVKWIQIQNRKYEKGLIILHNCKLYEVKQIIECDGTFFLWATIYCFVGIDSSLNCVKIAELKPEIHSLIMIDSFDCPNLYEKKTIDDETCVICDCLEITRAYKQTL